MSTKTTEQLKFERIAELIQKGERAKEIAAQTGCALGYVYIVKKQIGEGKKAPIASGGTVEFSEEVKNYITEEVKKLATDLPAKEIVVNFNNKKTKIEGLQHYAFETVLKCIAARTNVMLVGPAGSGKSTVVENAAKALGLNFYAMSVGLQTSKVEFMGYMNATGEYVKTHFRDAYEKGGVFLIDEIDAGNPGIMTTINAALANGVCAFPDAMVKKHENFVCIAAANTFGKGADRMYVGRNQLDAATLDRFVKMNFDYDENLERQLATNKDWCSLIQKIRAVVAEKKLRIVVSPRATLNGCQLLAAGLTKEQALDLVLFYGCSIDEQKNISVAL